MDTLSGLDEHLIAGRAAHGSQRINQRYTGRKHRCQRACPPRYGRFFENFAKHRYLQGNAVNGVRKRRKFLPAIPDDEANDERNQGNDVPKLNEPVGHRHHHIGEPRQVSTKARKNLLKRWNHKPHDDGDHHDRHHNHRCRIEHRRFDLAFKGNGFFFINGEPVKNRIQNTRLLASGDQIAEEFIKLHWVTPEGHGEAVTRFDITFHFKQ